MGTYLLTWNPEEWPWDDLTQNIEEVRQKGFHLGDWSTGRSKRIRRGDRLFLIRLGKEPKGIIGSGTAESNVFEGPHWRENDRKRGKQARYVRVSFDRLFNPDEEPDRILHRRDLDGLGRMHWDSQASGVTIPDAVARRLEDTWASMVSQGFRSPKSGPQWGGFRKVGAGFGDPAINKKVEASAISFVRSWYEGRGWRVRSVEVDKCGFDLLCRKGRSEKHVEVKGVQGGDPKFVITANELRQAKSDSKFSICILTRALSEDPELLRYPGKSLLEEFSFEPIAFWALQRNES
jgi:hypothetical protein